jgi:formylglycine-generating enzyme required for sulfatase activity
MHRQVTRALGWFLAGTAVLAVSAGEGKTPAERKEQILHLFADEFVSLSPGRDKFPAEFVMGSDDRDAPASEKPAHQVKLAYAFAIAKYEVTQELYEAVIGKNPSRWRGPRNSVEMVSWDEAQEFCRKATIELRRAKLLREKEVIRLPSEAEWEYACRAGTKTRYSFGNSADALGEYAWFTGNAKGNDPPVGKKKPNPWGLCDLHGYVWEWCQDAWHDSYRGAPDNGAAWEEKEARERVVRGGAWTEKAEACCSAFRNHKPVDHRSADVGFRCVRAEEAPSRHKEDKK